MLLLLTLALPFRGALAELVHCAGTPTPVVLSASASAGHGPAAAHAHHAAATPQQALAGAKAHAKAHGEAHAGAELGDGCKVCGACCMTPALVQAPQPPALSLRVASTTFPPLTTPSPSHPSEGLDRPPRSL